MRYAHHITEGGLSLNGGAGLQVEVDSGAGNFGLLPADPTG